MRVVGVELLPKEEGKTDRIGVSFDDGSYKVATVRPDFEKFQGRVLVPRAYAVACMLREVAADAGINYNEWVDEQADSLRDMLRALP